MSATAVRPAARLLTTLALCAFAAGCGGSSSSSSTSSGAGAGSATSATSATTSSSAGSAAAGGTTQATGSEVTGSSGGLRATLHAPDHTPKAGVFWHYSVRASSSSGKPVSGTVETQFAFGGQVVGRESPPSHPLTHGRLNDKVTFPARAVGVPLTFRVVVHTHLGTITLDWPVKVST
jgi:hypothetical protein